MEIRKATVSDTEEIASLLVSFYNMDFKEAKSAFVNERSKGHHYLVAVLDGKIVGIVTWLMHGLSKHGLCELDRILVSKDARGEGLGKKLLDALIKDASEFYSKFGGSLRKLYLLTHADNKKAQGFYEKIGFKHEVTLKEHYYSCKDEFMYSMFF